MLIKHLRLRGERVFTPYGVVDLNSEGFVIKSSLSFDISLLEGRPDFEVVQAPVTETPSIIPSEIPSIIPSEIPSKSLGRSRKKEPKKSIESLSILVEDV